MSRLLYCARNGCTFESVAGALPSDCPQCHLPTSWRTMPWAQHTEPKVPYRLTKKDTRMLRAIWIDPEDDEPDNDS